MGFADYLSSHPSCPAAPTYEDDKKFVVHTIQEIKHAILKQNIAPFGASKPTGDYNQSESKNLNEQNDVTHTKQNTHTKESAFCHSKLINKSLYSLPNFTTQNYFQLIAITTCTNPNKNTFDVAINKRKLAPNTKSNQMVTNSQKNHVRLKHTFN